MSDDRKEARVEELLTALEHMAGGDLDRRVTVSPAHDEIDAIAHGVNVLVGELQYTTAGLERARQEAEGANRAKTAFLRNISHEIRTPLSAILGLAELLAAQPASEEGLKQLLPRMLSNGRVLLALVDDLLDLAKVEAGRLQLESEGVDPFAIVAETVANLEIEAARKGLKLTLEADGALPEKIATDPKRLRQILTNLIGNAIKFTESGNVDVRVAWAASRLVIEVSDTGIGVSALQESGLFEPFHQGDGSIAPRYGGSGLGLALSRRIAEGLGGTLELSKSAPGATFRVTLPASITDLPPPPRRSGPPAPTGRELAGVRLLLVDDNEDIRAPLRELLQLYGAEVSEAGDGPSSVRLTLGGGFDLVLMDVRMPGVDGLEATRQLRQAGVRVPIVALTADAVDEHRAECLAAGCDERVTKPVELDQLVEVVRALVGRR